MSSVRSIGNRSTELKLRMQLVRSGIRGWRSQVKEVPGTPDFLFDAEHVAIFVDGCFWHGCKRCSHVMKTNPSFWKAKIERNRQRDCEITRRLKQEGFRVLRFWEHDLGRSSNAVDQIIFVLQGSPRAD